MVTFAVTLSDLIERGGSYAGLAAFFGLAVMAILYFAQAREVRRLRDWAGRAPERAQELEERVAQQAQAARGVQAQPIRRPGEPATAAAQRVPKPAPAVADAAQNTAAIEPPAAEDDSATEHSVVPAKPAVEGPPQEGDGAPVAPAEAQPEPVAAGEQSEDEAASDQAGQVTKREVMPAGAVASAATTIKPPPDVPATPGNGTSSPAEPALPARATQGPPVRRSAPAPAPLRASGSATRRPGAPPRRPGPPPPIRRDQEPHGRRTGILAAGGVAGVVLVVVGLIALLGGGDDTPSTNPEPTVASQTATATPGGAGGEPSATPASGPTRAETSVAVLNGTTVAGLAANIEEQLTQGGYATAQDPTNWTDSARSASVVFYASSEYRSQAIEVADLLDVPDRQPIIEEATALAPEADVVVVVGADQTP